MTQHQRGYANALRTVAADQINNRQVSANVSTNRNRIVGEAVSNSLKAAAVVKTRDEKAVFSVHNVSMDYTEEDLRIYCRALNIRVLFCFDITKGGQNSRSFKLAVRKCDVPTVTDSSCWPAKIVLREWNYNTGLNTTTDSSVIIPTSESIVPNDGSMVVMNKENISDLSSTLEVADVPVVETSTVSVGACASATAGDNSQITLSNEYEMGVN